MAIKLSRGVVAFVLGVACGNACTRPRAQQSLRGPNTFEIGYRYLASDLAQRAAPSFYGSKPEAMGAALRLCDRIQPSVFEASADMGFARPPVQYTQSTCFADVAHAAHDPTPCARVRTATETPRTFRMLSGPIHRQSRAECEADATDGSNIGGGYHATELLFTVMGYERRLVTEVVHEPADSSDLLQSYQSHVLHTIPDVDDADALEREFADFLRRLDRLPDFSQSDAAAAQQLRAIAPRWDDENNTDRVAQMMRCGAIRLARGDSLSQACDVLVSGR